MRMVVARRIALAAVAAGAAACGFELLSGAPEFVEAAGWLAAGLGCAALSLLNGRQYSQLARRSRQLAEDAEMADMAERLAGFGRWCAYPDGRQEWSDGLLRIAGFPAGCTPDFETRRELLPDGGTHFYRHLRDHRDDRSPFGFEFEIDRVDGQRRIFRVVAQNVFDEAGDLVRRQGVAFDVTDDARTIDRLGEACGEALKRVEEALALAETDPLTGLPNRRRAMAEVDRAILRAGRNRAPLALALFDIDHFKVVNDRFGHAAGDAVLVRIGRIATQACRQSDLVGRIGGEEFLWILPDAALKEASEAGERLRRAIAEGSAAGSASPVTASIGLALWRPGETALGLFARADAALYAAKGAGRNTIRKAA